MLLDAIYSQMEFVPCLILSCGHEQHCDLNVSILKEFCLYVFFLYDTEQREMLFPVGKEAVALQRKCTRSLTDAYLTFYKYCIL